MFVCHKVNLKLFLFVIVQYYFIVVCTKDIMILDLCSLTVLHKVIVV